jgi:DNA-binding NtrC family response regulator
VGADFGPSVLCLPWSVGGRPAGCACLVRREGRDPYTRENLEFLSLVLSPAVYLLSRDAENGPRSEGGADSSGRRISPFLGSSPPARRVRALIDKVSRSDTPVFIEGESGTGKELAARTIHEQGPRKGGGFIAVNCGAIPENLLESELFGHARGAFTGALRDKPGLIEEAHGGTFFLDEIGDLPFPLQAKLLRVLEEKRIRRVGENRSRQIDTRFISATNKDIEGEVSRKNFREDLFYRLKIIGIELPPLRERREDIPLLVDHFLDEFSVSKGRPRSFFSPLALELLVAYPWPGNVRELQNEIQRCLVIAGGTTLLTEDLVSPKVNPRGETGPSAIPRFFEAKAEFEKRFLREALVRCDYHRTRTAAEIGLTRQGLFKLIKKHGID